jgi:predicted ATPase/DNA-binding CsgD family transcriptional regulator
MERPATRPFAGLPAYASRFIGRERELRQLAADIDRNRLVTLTGPAGSGKTRLALEVGDRLSRNRADGVFFVDLAALREAVLLPEAFAGALGITQAQSRPLLETVVDRLRDLECLLIVDNCEHLVEACASILDHLLRSCRELKVLATSRESLRVDGEVVWDVPPLVLPPNSSSVKELARSEAVQFFIEKARQAVAGFELSAANAASVASICRRLDGLPLALELAAARTRVLDVDSIGRQLDDRFRFLTGGFRTAPPRQRTLRAAIDWSFDLLTAGERELFVRLAVFAGTFDAAAAAAVCAAGAVVPDRVLDGLDRLIAKSLLVPITLPAGPRYRLLDSLRAYGAERLRDDGELQALRRRHCVHFVSLAEEDGEAAESIRRMSLEIDNLREALAWSRDVDPHLHLRLAVPFATYCMRAGFMREGRAWLEPALRGAVHETALLAGALEAAAMLAWRQDDFEKAIDYATSAAGAARSLGDEVLLARVLGVLTFVLIGAQRFAKVEQPVDEMLAIAQRRGDPLIEGDALSYRALVLAHGEDTEQACDLMLRGAALYEAEGKGDEVAMPYNVVGWMRLRQLDPARARPAIARGLELRFHQRQIADLCGSLDAAAELAFVEGAPERALRIKGATDAIRDSLGSAPPSLAVASRARWVPRAEKRLGNKGRQALLEGRRLSVEEAVAYALAAASAPPPRSAGRGELALSDREMEIAGLVAGGLSNDEIAAQLKLSRRTVEAHLDHIRTKLGARSRVEVATWVAARSSPQPA